MDGSMNGKLASASSLPLPPTVVNADIIETHKENIVPTRDGRSATAISQLYSVPRAQRVKHLTEQHAFHRQAIANPPDPDDPLAPYCSYVQWTTENYPSGSSSESGLFALLEEVTRKFHADDEYKYDRRYVKLWLQYAHLSEHSQRVLAYMIANDIGTMQATPYEEYAEVLERNGK